jgi:hypothetical protein
VGVVRSFQPFGGATLDPQWIGKQAGRDTEREYEYTVKNCKDDPSLEISNCMAYTFPSLPRAF